MRVASAYFSRTNSRDMLITKRNQNRIADVECRGVIMALTRCRCVAIDGGSGLKPSRPKTRTLARPNYSDVYMAYPGERFSVPAVSSGDIDPHYLRQTVEFGRKQSPGSIVVDPASYHLYFIESPGVATRYGVGVGREGFGWSGAAKINMKRDWPDWVPPQEMIERDPKYERRLKGRPAVWEYSAAPRTRWEHGPCTCSIRRRPWISHPWHPRAVYSRDQRFVGLRADYQSRYHPPLRARRTGDAGYSARRRGVCPKMRFGFKGGSVR